jgi:hypothetical protein
MFRARPKDLVLTQSCVSKFSGTDLDRPVYASCLVICSRAVYTVSLTLIFRSRSLEGFKVHYKRLPVATPTTMPGRELILATWALGVWVI